jgi:hypothetical protein
VVATSLTFLPVRRSSPQPAIWRDTRHASLPVRAEVIQTHPVKQRASLLPLVLTVVCAMATGWMVRSAIEWPRQPHVIVVRSPDVHVNAPPAAAPQPQSSFWNWLNGDRCADADGRVRDWGNPNRAGGGGPIDVFGFLPKCEGGR